MKRTYLYLILTIIIIGLVVTYPHFLISPGNLYQAHSEIQNNCLACHKPISGTPNEKCISCHKISEISKNNSILKLHEMTRYQSCTSCHSEHKGIDYKVALNKFNHSLLPEKDRNSCVSCHQPPKDNFHTISTNNCVTCHSVKKWKPSTFNHNKFFVLDNNHNVSCSTCHTTNDYKNYTCFGCHEHSMNNIREKHIEEGITNFVNCIKCHRNANEDDIQMSESEVKNYINKEFKNNKEID
jgi:hypothetical protein